MLLQISFPEHVQSSDPVGQSLMYFGLANLQSSVHGHSTPHTKETNLWRLVHFTGGNITQPKRPQITEHPYLSYSMRTLSGMPWRVPECRDPKFCGFLDIMSIHLSPGRKKMVWWEWWTNTIPAVAKQQNPLTIKLLSIHLTKGGLKGW